MSEEKLHRMINNRVPGLLFILVTFAVLEFGILLVCLAFSANQDIVRVYSPDNTLIYENTYNLTHLKEFKAVYGIDNFKDNGFVLKRIKKENKFPTRAWIALSVCIPLILILFVAFIIKVFEDMFQARKKKTSAKNPEKESDFEETRFERLFSTLGRLNIYSLGTTVLLIAFLYWMVPDLLVYIGKIGYQTLSEFKWVILGVAAIAGLYLVVHTILAHKTRNEIIRQQASIQKHRDRLAIEAKLGKPLLADKPENDTP
ncbi:MAG TPA: hypothetical protein DHV36_05365 [Desulfobacteraceae bacterium]|nr:hypothetical protein [Desulfobacteraceae bacterium]